MGLTSRGGRRPAQPARRHCRADDAHARRRGGGFSGDRRRRSDDPMTLVEDFEPPGCAAGRPASIPDYRASLVRDGLKGARIGVLRQAYERDTTDPEIVEGLHGRTRGFEEGRRDHRRSGASRAQRHPAVAQGAGPAAGSNTTSTVTWRRSAIACRSRTSKRSSARAASIHRSRLRLDARAGRYGERPRLAACKAEAEYRERSARPCRDDGGERPAGVRLSDVEQPAAADRRPEHAARRQQPGLLADDRLARDQGADGLHARWQLPAGITFFGRAWDEATLIKLAYGYEQATKHRRPPQLR